MHGKMEHYKILQIMIDNIQSFKCKCDLLWNFYTKCLWILLRKKLIRSCDGNLCLHVGLRLQLFLKCPRYFDHLSYACSSCQEKKTKDSFWKGLLPCGHNWDPHIVKKIWQLEINIGAVKYMAHTK